MSTYNLKAKNKQTGEIMEIYKRKEKDYFEYYYTKNFGMGQITNKYGEKEFNELYEIVEDNITLSPCCNKPVHIIPNGVICPTINGGCGEWCELDVSNTCKEHVKTLHETWQERFEVLWGYGTKQEIKDLFKQELERICEEVKKIPTFYMKRQATRSAPLEQVVFKDDIINIIKK